MSVTQSGCPTLTELAARLPPGRLKKLFRQPVFIVSSPRSGSTLLFETLAKIPALWTVGGESHAVFRDLPQLQAEANADGSGRLTRAQANNRTAHLLRAGFVSLLQDCHGRRYLDRLPAERPAQLRFLEKTPRNALNIPFLNRIFPDARFLFLFRDPRENINSIMEAWEEGNRSGRFVTHDDLPGWDRRRWCLLLPPGWRELNGRSLADIAAFQWRAANAYILQDLQDLPAARWTVTRYQDLIASPGAEIARLRRFAGLARSQDLEALDARALPLSRTTVTPPAPDKWRQREEEILTVLSSVEPLWQRLESLAASASPGTAPSAGNPSAAAAGPERRS